MEASVRLAVEVRAAPAEAFRVFTEEFGDWYRIGRHTVKDARRAVAMRVEPGVGGRLVEVHDAATGEGPTIGTITVWEPGRRLVFRDEKDCEIDVLFDPIAGGTRVSIETRGLDQLDPEEAKRVSRHGWHIVTRWFEAHLARTPDMTVTGLVPYLFYEDAAAMLKWYARVFGFVEKGRWSNPDGTVQNAEMRVGATELWLDGGGRRICDPDGKPLPLWVGVWVDDVDAVYTRVKAAGVEARPPEDQPYGVRMLTVADPEGYQWGFMKRLAEKGPTS